MQPMAAASAGGGTRAAAAALTDQAKQAQNAERSLRTLQSTLGGADRAASQTAVALQRLNTAYAGGKVGVDEYLRLQDQISQRFSVAGVNAADLRRNMAGLHGGFERLNSVVGLGTNILAAFGVTLGVAGVVRLSKAVLSTADEYQNLTAQIRLAIGEHGNLAAAQQRVFEIAQTTRQELSTTTSVFTRLSNAMRDTGMSTNEVLSITETLGKAIAVSGRTSAEASAALLQLSQAMASGRLQGDELRSVMENLPILADAIAKEMGVAKGALKELGAEGKITSEVVGQAVGSMGPAIEKQFATIPTTVSGAMTQIRNSFKQLIGDTERSTASTENLAKALSTLGTTIGSSEFRAGFQDFVAEGVQVFITTLEEARAIAAAFESAAAPFEAFGEQATAAIGGVTTTIDETIAAFERLRDQSVAAVEGMVTGVDEWMTTGLEGALAGVQSRLQGAVEAFEWMRTVVVGQSIVPEMVEDIQGWMERLEPTMAEPARVAVDRALEEFERLPQHIRRGLLGNLGEIKGWQEAGLAQGQAAGAGGPERELPEAFKNALESVQNEFANTFDDISQATIGSFEDMADAAHNIFTNLASNIATVAIFEPQKLQEQFAAAGLTPGQGRAVTGAALATPLLGLGVGMFGNQGARQGLQIGGGVGAAGGALVGSLIPGIGTMVGATVGGLGGSLLGSVFGGLFGGGESGREIRNLRGGLGAVGGTGQAAQAVQQFDQQFIAFLTARQEAIVDQALRAAAGVSVKYGKEGPSANDLASLARSRIGPAAQALGFNVAGVTAGTPEQQFANLQKAVELFRQIESFRIGPIQTQFRDLDETFAEMGAEAARLGVATAGLAEQHLLARQALERQIRLEKVAVAGMVGALDPIAAQFQTLELQMQDAAARAIELGVSTAKVAQAHQLAAETLKRRIQLEQVAVAVQVGALDQITAQFQTLELQMQETAAQAAAFGISTANIGRAHQLAVGALKRRIELEKIAVAETVGTLNPLMAALQTLERNMQEASARAQELGVSTAKISQAHSLAARTLIQQDLIQRHTVLGTIGAWTDLQVAFGNLNAEMQLAAIEAERFGYSTRSVHTAFALGVQELIQQDRLRRHTVLGTIGAWTDLQVAISNLNAEMQLAAIEAQRLGYAAGSVHKAFSLAVEELIQQDRLRRHANLEQIGLWSPLRRALADLDAEMQLARVEAERLGYSTAYVAREQQRLAQEIIRAHEAQIDAMALSIGNPFKELAEPLREFQMELEFALLNPLNQAQRAQDEFRRVATQAAGGDLDALRQLEQAGQFYIEQMGRFGASPGQVAATQEVASVVTNALDQIERARRDAEHGVENEIRLASQRQVDKLDELVVEVRLVGEEIKRMRRF